MITELIERYLQAVRFALPEAERDDIIKELRDNLLSQIEEREAALGRVLNEDDVVQLLKTLGRPSQLAAKYGPARQLIGPATFPIYAKVMKTVLGLVFLVHVGISVATAATGRSLGESLAVLFLYPRVALIAFAIVTIVFGALERAGTKLKVFDRWDPLTLPGIIKTPRTRKSRLELVAELALKAVFGIWWLVGLKHPWSILGPGAKFVGFAPVWQTLFPLFVVSISVDIALTMAMLARPDWHRGRAAIQLAKGALGLIVLYFLIDAPALFVSVDGSPLPLRELGPNVNRGVHLGLVIAAIINVVNILRHAVQLIGKSLGKITHAAA